MSSRAEASHRRLPPLPDTAKEGKPFTCEVCNRCVKIQAKRDWKKYIFHDLMPYNCVFDGCYYGTLPFFNFETMVNHIGLEHHFEPLWDSRTCPLCRDPTRKGRDAISLHLARHLEEIALTALPRDPESEDEKDMSESETKSDYEDETKTGAAELHDGSMSPDSCSNAGTIISASQLEARDVSTSYIDARSRHLPQVTSFSPKQALHGAKLFVYIHTTYDLTTQPKFFSIMFGNKRCKATCSKDNRPGAPYFGYAVATEIPPFDSIGYIDGQMPLLLHVEDEFGNSLRVIEVGDFTYDDTSRVALRVYFCECCPERPRKFDSMEELCMHELEKGLEKQYTCAYCPNRFRIKNEAERHQNSVHLRRHSWSCSALSDIHVTFYPSTQHPSVTDVCGYCGEEFLNPADWDVRAEHLNYVHKFGECNQAKKFFRADHFRQHLKHSHAGTSGKWTNMLENACMKDEPPPKERVGGGTLTAAAAAGPGVISEAHDES